jgi:phage gp36-like protein
MPYITSAELRARFGEVEIDELADRLNLGAPDEAVIDRAIADAGALIDAHLSGRYTLPLATTPDIVQSWAADIARFKLWDERAPEEVRNRYDDALAQLKLMAQGVINLPPDAEGVAPAAGVAFASYSADRLFTAEKLCGY